MTQALRFQMHGLWRPRQESVEECAQRARQFFKGLRASSPRFKQWYLPGTSKKKSLERKVDVRNLDTLTKLLLKGRNRTDIGRQVIEELGFSISLWNGAKQYDDEAGVSVFCGAYCDVAGMPTPNNVSVDFPPALNELSDWRRMAAVLSSVANAWEPNYLEVSSSAAKRARTFTRPFVDWMFFVSKGMYLLPESLDAVHVEHIGNLGTIVVVQEEPPDPENEEHNRNIARVRSALALDPD
jgi:hypothetical protein